MKTLLFYLLSALTALAAPGELIIQQEQDTSGGLPKYRELRLTPINGRVFGWNGTALTNVDLSGYATTAALGSGLAGKQNSISFGAGILNALGINAGSTGAPVLFGAALGTPSSGNLANCTLPTISVTGDATGSGTTSISTTVSKINGTALSGLATGLLKNTTATGVPTIAVAGTDYVAPGSAPSFTSLTLSSGGLYLSNYGSGIAIPGGGVVGAYLRGPATTSPFGFSAANGGNISASAPLFYYSWVGSSASTLGFSSFTGSTATNYLTFNAASGVSLIGKTTFQPGIGTTQTASANGDLVIEATSNTTLTLKLKGSDGTVRTATITLAP